MRMREQQTTKSDSETKEKLKSALEFQPCSSLRKTFCFICFVFLYIQESTMLYPKIELCDGLSFRSCRVFIILLTQCLTVCVAGQSELICSHQPIVALAGDDVILPCYLDPPISASSETVVWTRPGLDPKYIHVHRDGRPANLFQNPYYFLRARLFVDELQNGNVSMKIFRVKISDAGKYFCFLEPMLKEASIQLTVGKSDFLKMMNYTFVLTAKISNVTLY
uniref:Ig-like domain-containing protein n=1 Tax=Dicentrarchus labrax TaxID=13489 RepID=A0A8P4GAZ5_DICLA